MDWSDNERTKRMIANVAGFLMIIASVLLVLVLVLGSAYRLFMWLVM